jgi:hypothetical protein
MVKQVIQLFSSLRLTVTCLVLGCVIVFWGTLAQVQIGLYRAQSEIFRSYLIYWHPAGASWKIPIFPGGYLIGGVLLINLVVSHFRYYQPGKRKIGIALIHLGIVLLLAGQMLTDVLSVESTQHLRLGEAKNYSESERASELAVIDITDTNTDKVLAIPCQLLWPPAILSVLPIAVSNSGGNLLRQLRALRPSPTRALQPVKASAGFGSGLWWRELPHETDMQKTDVPSAIVAINGTPRPGRHPSWFLNFSGSHKRLSMNGRQYELVLRPNAFICHSACGCWNSSMINIPAPTSRKTFPVACGCNAPTPARIVKS